MGKAGAMDRTPASAPRGPALFRRLAGVSTAPALAVLVTLLCVVGLVMVGSASPVISLITYGSPWTIFIRQVLWMVVGVGALLVFAKVDYRKWRKFGVPLVVVTVGLLLAVLVPGLGVTAGGSSRWIGFGQLRTQPSELMKLALVVFAADIVVRRTDRDAPAKQVIAPVMGVLVVSAALIIKQPDMGTAMVLSCTAFGILFMGGVPLAPLTKVLGAFGGIALVFAFSSTTGATASSRSSTPAPTSRDRATRSGSPSSGWGPATCSGWAWAAGARSGGRCPTPTPTSSSRWWGRSWAGRCRRRHGPVLRPGLVRATGPPAGRPTASAASWPWA